MKKVFLKAVIAMFDLNVKVAASHQMTRLTEGFLARSFRQMGVPAQAAEALLEAHRSGLRKNIEAWTSFRDELVVGIETGTMGIEKFCDLYAAYIAASIEQVLDVAQSPERRAYLADIEFRARTQMVENGEIEFVS